MDAGWVREVETIERSAWAELYSAPPQAFKEGLGLAQQRFGSALALAAKNVASTQFNRVFGFGADAPAREQDVDDAIVFMHANAAPHWIAQCADKDAARWFEARGFQPNAIPWAKMARGRAAPMRITTSLAIDEIGLDAADAFGTVVCAGYGAPLALAPWFKALAGRSGWRLYLGRDGIAAAAGVDMLIFV